MNCIFWDWDFLCLACDNLELVCNTSCVSFLANEPLISSAVRVCAGWRFGAVYGKSGLFPGEYVRPVAAPDFLVLPAERLEPRDRQGRVAASAAIAVAMGSAIAAHELDLSMEVHTRKLFTHISAAFF